MENMIIDEEAENVSKIMKKTELNSNYSSFCEIVEEDKTDDQASNLLFQ